jgi:hypothetical protein
MTDAQVRHWIGSSFGRNAQRTAHLVINGKRFACGEDGYGEMAPPSALIRWLLDPLAYGNCRRCAKTRAARSLQREHRDELEALRAKAAATREENRQEAARRREELDKKVLAEGVQRDRAEWAAGFVRHGGAGRSGRSEPGGCNADRHGAGVGREPDPSTARRAQMRPENGPLRFGEDWPGVFIRGDDALNYAKGLSTLIARASLSLRERNFLAPELAALVGLRELLASVQCTKGVAPARTQQVKSWDECQIELEG